MPEFSGMGEFSVYREHDRLRKVGGQALVEVALIFPIFLILVFGVMQLGQLAAMTIIVNHASFEVARIGAITADYPPPPGADESFSQMPRCENTRVSLGNMVKTARKITEGWPGKLVEPLQYKIVPTMVDPEVNRRNCDLYLQLQFQMPLVFPFVNFFFAQPPYGGYDPEVGTYRILTGESRMPLEMPLWGSTGG